MPQTITRRTGEETQKRSMMLRDDSGRSIEVTLWGALVHNPGDMIQQVCCGLREAGRWVPVVTGCLRCTDRKT